MWVILTSLAVYNSDTWAQVLQEHILYSCVVGILVGWTFTEYYLHRFELHQEVTLDQNAPYSKEQGKRNADNFSKHIHHHVFMNQRRRIVVNLPGHWQLIVAVFFVLSLVLTPSRKYHLMAGWLLGNGLYDWMHLSFHFGPELEWSWW